MRGLIIALALSRQWVFSSRRTEVTLTAATGASHLDPPDYAGPLGFRSQNHWDPSASTSKFGSWYRIPIWHNPVAVS